MTKETKITYSAMAGELRKSARLYEVFKSASEAADILATYEREEKAIINDIGLLKKEFDGLDAKCNESYAKQQQAEKELITLKETSNQLIQKAKSDAEKIIARANEQAEKNLNEVKNKLILIQNNIKTANIEAVASDNARKDSLEALAKVEKQIQTAKNKFLKTLG